jgi:hypothetical protein
VVEEVSDDNPLIIRIANGYMTVTGEIKETDLSDNKNIDVAYIKLDIRMVKELGKHYLFLPISKFRKHLELLDYANYCVLGFPAANQKIVEGKLKTGASMYLAKPCKAKVYKYYEFDPESSYIISLHGKATDFKTGDSKKVDNRFHGISGCGLWLILPKEINGNMVCDYRLIGIMTEFRKSPHYCLIGNRIELILQGLTNFECYQYRVIPITD